MKPNGLLALGKLKAYAKFWHTHLLASHPRYKGYAEGTPEYWDIHNAEVVWFPRNPVLPEDWNDGGLQDGAPASSSVGSDEECLTE